MINPTATWTFIVSILALPKSRRCQIHGSFHSLDKRLFESGAGFSLSSPSRCIKLVGTRWPRAPYTLKVRCAERVKHASGQVRSIWSMSGKTTGMYMCPTFSLAITIQSALRRSSRRMMSLLVECRASRPGSSSGLHKWTLKSGPRPIGLLRLGA